MYKNKIIRPFTALLLLLLFVISNSPKQLLHDIFANHIDSKTRLVSTTDAFNINQQSFHCQCDHLVIESPFTKADQLIAPCEPLIYPHFTTSLYRYISVDCLFQFDLRGPPAA